MDEIKRMLSKVRNGLDRYKIQISDTNRCFKRVSEDLSKKGIRINLQVIDENHKRINASYNN